MDMNRFRVKAKRKFNNVWIQGYVKEYTNPQETMVYNPYEDINYVVDNNTVCQITQMYDKNHEPIWEGDILEDRYGRKGKVTWDMNNGMFVLVYPHGVEALTTMLPLFECDVTHTEVIGNIYDNPELLK